MKIVYEQSTIHYGGSFLAGFFSILVVALYSKSKFRSAAETELEWAVADHHQTPPPQQT